MRSALATAVLILALSACTRSAPQAAVPTPAQGNTVRVAATLFPLAAFVEHIGGAYVTVMQQVPDGAEAHDYEPSPANIAESTDADLFIMNGGGIDPWATEVRTQRATYGKPTVSVAEVLLGQGGVDGGIADNDVVNDPHLWLSPKNAKRIGEAIFAQLIALDPPHAQAYTKQLLGFSLSLAQLDEAYRAGLAKCAKTTVIVPHDAYRVLAEEYGFKTIPIAGFSPEAEPSTKRLREIIDLARAENIRYVLHEPTPNTQKDTTVAEEIGAKLLPVHPIEWLTHDERANGTTYFSLMRENLSSLRTALECR